MSVLTTFTASTESFAPGIVLDKHPEVKIRLESMVPVEETTIPYIWVIGLDPEQVREELSAAGDISTVELADVTGQNVLVRVMWREEGDRLTIALKESRATVLEAVGTNEGWTFTVRFIDRSSLSSFYSRCLEEGIQLTPKQIETSVGPLGNGDVSGLTEPQRKALLRAREQGYFEVPRRISLEELGEQLGISDSAVSQRVRRGTEALIDHKLTRTASDFD